MSTQMITNPPVLDTTGQAIVAALNNLTEATSPTNVYIDIPLSIPVSGWDDNTPHVYTWMNENIVGNCGIEVGFADGAEDVATTFIRVTKIVGGIKFSIDEVPSAPIPLIVRIINAKADSVIGDIDATMVETSAIAGVTNVEEALTDLDGRVDDNADDIASNSTAIANLNSNVNRTVDIIADAANCTVTKFFYGAGANYTGTVPDDNFKYGTFIVNVRDTGKNIIAQSTVGTVAVNSYRNGWSGWKVLASTDDVYGVEGTITLSFYAGAYTSGIYNQNIRYKVCGQLVMVNGYFKMSESATSNSMYAVFTGIPYNSKWSDIVGHLRCSNDGVLLGGVKLTSTSAGNINALTFYFNKQNGTYALKDQTIEFTVIYPKE